MTEQDINNILDQIGSILRRNQQKEGSFELLRQSLPTEVRGEYQPSPTLYVILRVGPEDPSLDDAIRKQFGLGPIVSRV